MFGIIEYRLKKKTKFIFVLHKDNDSFYKTSYVIIIKSRYYNNSHNMEIIVTFIIVIILTDQINDHIDYIVPLLNEITVYYINLMFITKPFNQ